MEKNEIVEMEKYLNQAVENPRTVGAGVGEAVLKNIERMSLDMVYEGAGTVGVGQLALDMFKAEMTYKMLRAMFSEASVVDDEVARARENTGTALVI